MTGALTLSGKVEKVGDIQLKLEGMRDFASVFIYPDANKDELAGQEAAGGVPTVAVKDVDGAMREMVPGRTAARPCTHQ